MNRPGPPPVPGGRSAEERERARAERQARREDAGEAPHSSPPRPGPPQAPSGGHLRRVGRPRLSATVRRRRLAAVAAALVALGIVWFAVSLFQPFGGEGEGSVRVVVPEGGSVAEIGDLLEERGVISSSFFFGLRARLSGESDDLKPGAFELRRDMSYAAALDALAAGVPPDVVRITVPEGRSRNEVADIVGSTALEGDYERATQGSPALDPVDYGAEGAESLEGFLFPATYELKRGSSVQRLVVDQLAAFRREFASVDLSAAKRKNLTAYDVLIIASMVEREAQLAKERRLIASVIYNRLSEGIPLGIDATIRYATDNWERPLTESQLEIDSPYNTRAEQGLPPGPIGSPGIDAIRAAANPASTDFLYYVVKPNTCGEHQFSESSADFERDRQRYEEERARRGGMSPTDCPS